MTGYGTVRGMRHALIRSLFAGVLGASFASAAFAQTAAEVIDKHLTAVGGRAALGKLTSRKSTGTVSISTPGGVISGPIEISLKAPNKSRVAMQMDLSAMGVADRMSIEQRFDGAAGAMLNSMQGNNEITGNQLENMKNNIFPTPLLNYQAAGATVDLLPKEQLAGKDVIVLRFTPKSGSAVRLYLDGQTYLIVRTVAKVSAPELGEYEQVSEPSDYRVVDGVKVPFSVVNSNQVQTIRITLTTVQHNVAIDDAIFTVREPPRH